jgi:hypothetical protein
MKLILSASLAVASLLLAAGASANDGTSDQVPVASPPRAWAGVQERNVWGLAPASRATDDFGADVLAGAWLLGDHLEPILDIGWSRVVSHSDERIDTFRAGWRLAAGSGLASDHLWLGGALGAVVQAGWLHGPGTSLAWAASPSVSGLAQARLARLLLGAELGVEHSIPPLEWRDFSVFHSFRLQLAFQLGVIL